MDFKNGHICIFLFWLTVVRRRQFRVCGIKANLGWTQVIWISTLPAAVYASRALRAAALMHRAQRSPVLCTTLPRNPWLGLTWHTERSINKVKEQPP